MKLFQSLLVVKAVQSQIGIDPTLTKCQSSAQTDSNIACTDSGLFERTQCSVLNSVMQIHICRCVDEESGEDIPLTEKPVVGKNVLALCLKIISFFLQVRLKWTVEK